MSNDEKITVVLKRKKEISAPVKAGEVIGYISYYIKNKEWRKVELVIDEFVIFNVTFLPWFAIPKRMTAALAFGVPLFTQLICTSSIVMLYT